MSIFSTIMDKIFRPAGAAPQLAPQPSAQAAATPAAGPAQASQSLALRRAVLAERRTGATLGDAKATTNMLDAGAPTRRAQ